MVVNLFGCGLDLIPTTVFPCITIAMLPHCKHSTTLPHAQKKSKHVAGEQRENGEPPRHPKTYCHKPNPAHPAPEQELREIARRNPRTQQPQSLERSRHIVSRSSTTRSAARRPGGPLPNSPRRSNQTVFVIVLIHPPRHRPRAPLRDRCPGSHSQPKRFMPQGSRGKQKGPRFPSRGLLCAAGQPLHESRDSITPRIASTACRGMLTSDGIHRISSDNRNDISPSARTIRAPLWVKVM